MFWYRKLNDGSIFLIFLDRHQQTFFEKKAPALDSGASSAAAWWIPRARRPSAALGERYFAGPAAGPHGGVLGDNGDNGDGPGDGGDGQAQGFGEGGAPGGRSGRKRGELGRASETAIVDTIIEENAAYETKATPAPPPPRR